MSRLAVVIPHYKHDHCLDEAIDSVKDQDCDWYTANDNYPNLGKGFRMNEVMPIIDQEFVNIHDADDISKSNRFEVCAPYFDNYDVIYHDIFLHKGLWGNRVWEAQNVEDEYIIHRSREWDRELYKKVSYVFASTIIVRTEIAQKVEWPTNTYGQDWIWLNLIAEHTNRFKYIPESLLYYRGELGFTNDLKFKRVRRFFIRRKIARLTK